MKVLIVLALFVLAVYSQRCHRHSDCSSFGASNCPSDHYACLFGQCHCTSGSTGTKCTDSGDCPDCHERYLGKHCVDGDCRCTIDLGGGIGK